MFLLIVIVVIVADFLWENRKNSEMWTMLGAVSALMLMFAAAWEIAGTR